MNRPAEATAGMEKREFARIDTRLRMRVQPLDEAAAERLATRILTRPSVWVPSELATLRNLAAGASAGTDAVLSQAVLEIADQIAKLQAAVLDGEAPVKEATLVQLSGGGGMMTCGLPLEVGDRFECRFEADEDEDAPPVVAVCSVVHRPSAPRHFGFRFDVIHPHDQDLLVRFIYRLQRQALRRASLTGDDV